MPEDLSIERAQTMKAFGAELVLTPKSGGMEYARDLATQMEADGKGRVLDQFANQDNPRVHYETTGPELWDDTEGRITHFVSAMGTTGTITGVSRYLKEKNPAVRIVGAQPADGSRIPGIRKWPQAYLPKIYEPEGVDELILVTQADAEAPAGWHCKLPSRWRTPPLRSSSATAAIATCRPACSRHERDRRLVLRVGLLPPLRDPPGVDRAGRGRRSQDQAALHQLPVHALEQSDPGAGGHHRMHRP